MPAKNINLHKKLRGQQPASQNRRYALVFFYFGLLCVILSLFISFVYIRPTNFKTQFIQRQLADCLQAGTAATTCHQRFSATH